MGLISILISHGNQTNWRVYLMNTLSAVTLALEEALECSFSIRWLLCELLNKWQPLDFQLNVILILSHLQALLISLGHSLRKVEISCLYL